jgi:hypothetical protein
MKAHIFAGAVRLRKQVCKDYVWVTRDELEDYLGPQTLKTIKPLLAER